MVDRIAAVKTGEDDRPVQDISMTVELLSKKECKELDALYPPAP
jgi:peptidyl-prolyl cis-trans isomerase B (cyclophilin B)